MAMIELLLPQQPIAIGSSNGDNPSNVATPDPKEVWHMAAGIQPVVRLDLGSVMAIDRIFVGYINGSSTVAAYGNVGLTTYDQTTSAFAGTPCPASSWPGAPRHMYLKTASGVPVNARFVTIALYDAAGIGHNIAADITLGIVNIGGKWSPTWGQEWDAGRPVVDTGTVERLFSGGFGINPGTRVGGYQWAFGDIQESERESLYGFCRQVGLTTPFVVCEDPAVTANLNERLHYGLFTKLDTYDRLDPANTRFNFQMEEWG